MSKLQYKKRFVAFLDVLGFKEMVNSDNIVKIEKYLEISKMVIEEFKNTTSKQELKSITISDSIIFVMPFASDENESLMNLREFCIAILKVQSKLALENIWLRGAISFGNVHFDSEEKQIIGKAYIKAHELEGKAKYPRVILDNKFIEEFECKTSGEFIKKINELTRCTAYPEVLFKWTEQSKIEKDIPLFINFCTNDTFKIKQYLEQIKKNLSKLEVYDKYQWLAKYLASKTPDEQLLDELNQI